MEFQKANYKDLGGGDLQDEVHAAKFLVATGFVNPRKIGITGGSYGGYMAMIAIGRAPDVWAAAVELFGITDWLTEQQHEEPTLQQYDQSLLGDPVKDRKVYEKCSQTQPRTLPRKQNHPISRTPKRYQPPFLHRSSVK
jgi:dipeptidyl aminopeptidase/acylaminoacyl peptidase